MFSFFTKGITISSKEMLSIILLFATSFAWFNLFHHYFEALIYPGLEITSFLANLGQVIFLISTLIFAFIGSAISDKVDRRKFLISWILLGVLAFTPVIFFLGELPIIIFTIMGGLVFGLGFPSSLAFFAESTTPDERGRVAGLAVLGSFFLLVFSILLIEVLGVEQIAILFVLSGVKAIGLLSFILDPVGRLENKAKPWKSVFKQKDFNYYLLALILFYIAAGLVTLLWKGLPDDPDYLAAERLGNNIRYIGLGIFAVIAGVLADRIGRKKPVILGLIMLGAAYALVGILTSSQTYFIHLVLSGLAWGVIMVVYFVIPADLTYKGSAERFYAIGWLLPVILYIGLNGSGRLLGFVLPIDIFSTILSIILFASILPILYAVETLSESKMRERKLKEYTEKVGKIIQESKK